MFLVNTELGLYKVTIRVQLLNRKTKLNLSRTLSPFMNWRSIFFKQNNGRITSSILTIFSLSTAFVSTAQS